MQGGAENGKCQGHRQMTSQGYHSYGRDVSPTFVQFAAKKASTHSPVREADLALARRAVGEENRPRLHQEKPPPQAVRDCVGSDKCREPRRALSIPPKGATQKLDLGSPVDLGAEG